MPSAALLFEASDAFLSAAIAHVARSRDRPALIGLGGAQGSGKTSTASRLARRLAAEGFDVVTRSIDDFYLTHAERRRLANDVHPLLATRGVPGTHDVALLRQLLAQLQDATPDHDIPLPSFDKVADDRAAPVDWPRRNGQPDVIVLEGWCVGAHAQPPDALVEPVNALEREEDANGVWRRYVNDRLAGEYAAVFDRFDLMIYLRAPSFDQVFGWRAEQEAGLDRSGYAHLPPMSDAALRSFIAHYERLTRWMIAKPRCDILVDLDAGRCPVRWQRWQST